MLEGEPRTTRRSTGQATFWSQPREIGVFSSRSWSLGLWENKFVVSGHQVCDNSCYQKQIHYFPWSLVSSSAMWGRSAILQIDSFKRVKPNSSHKVLGEEKALRERGCHHCTGSQPSRGVRPYLTPPTPAAKRALRTNKQTAWVP